MPIPISHVSDKRPSRTFSGEKEARDVLGWLNFQLFEDDYIRAIRRRIEEVSGKRFTHRDEQRRIIEILRLYREYRADWEDRLAGIGHQGTESTKKTKSTSRKLRTQLRRYTFYPEFFPLGKLLSFDWVPTRPDHPDRYGEVSAIADLAKLAERDLLGNLRECSCGRWIWIRFSHQRFCSAKCREREFRSSEKWKEHRRKKAREYYRLHKHKNVK